MGFLDFETVETHTYQESKPLQKKSKRLAVRQFIKLYKKFADIKMETDSQHKYPKYGFELEVHALIKQEKDEGVNYVLESSLEYLRKNKNLGFALNHEYGAWMAEMVPFNPSSTFTYGGGMLNLLRCSFNKFYTYGRENSEFLSTVMYPKMGTKFMLKDLGLDQVPQEELIQKNLYSASPYMSDIIINPHPRFGTFTRNVRGRRGENPQIIVPLFQDIHTNLEQTTEDEPIAGHMHLDAFTFGMGMNCLQVTFSAKTVQEGR